MNKSSILDFIKYTEKEIIPAANELEQLEDKRRKHLQKLVYTNLINRFDAMVDHAILDNYKEGSIFEDGLKPLDGTVTEAEILKLLLNSDSVQEVVEKKVRESLSNTILRNRHSKKLSVLFREFCNNEECWNIPRVNINTGEIVEKFKVSNKKVPHSICGYADWLYSRRNALVHGIGTANLLENDVTQIDRLFRTKVTKQIRIKIGSIRVASKFYIQVANFLTK